MATYTLQILNNSGFNKNYVWFMQPPIITASGGQPEIFTNAWVTFTGVSPSGVDTVTYTDATFAYWATATIPVGPGTTMGQSGFAAVNTGTQDSVPFIGDATKGGIGFGTVAKGGAKTGSYRIIAGADFNASNGFVFGLARPGNIPGVPSPVATFVSQPNETYDITPVIKFYVADGAYVPGAIIDYSAESTTAGAVDFTGKAQTHAIVTQGSNGSFSVQYY